MKPSDLERPLIWTVCILAIVVAVRLLSRG